MTVRFKISHRERLPEWMAALVVFCWGCNSFVDSLVDVPRHTMDGPFFQPLLHTGMDQTHWGMFAIGIGLLRLTFLAINGTSPKGSTILRTAGGALSALFWFGFVLGAFAVPWGSGAVFTYGGWMMLDLFAVFFAAREIPFVFSHTGVAYGRRG